MRHIEYLSVREVADGLGTSEGFVRSLIRHGKLEALKVGERILIDPAALEALLSESRIAPKVPERQA